MIKACIFDLDGVIVDTAKYHYQAWKKLADELQISFSEERNEEMKGISRMASLEMLLSFANLDRSEEEKKELCAIKNSWYLDYISNMNEEEILPGVMEFLTNLKSNDIPFALGSASKNARTILDRLKLTNLFEVIVDGNDVIKSKPDPEVFLKGAGLLGYHPSQVVVFEDSAKGLDAAISGGFMTVGMGSEEHLGHADVVLPSLLSTNFHELARTIMRKR